MAAEHTAPIYLSDALAQAEARIAQLEKQLSAAQTAASAALDLRRQSQLLEQVHDAIIATDLDGHITLWNHGATRLYGYTAQEMLGRHVSELYFEQDRNTFAARILDPLLRDGQNELESACRRKNGAKCFVRLSLSILRSDAGGVTGLLGVATDITAQKIAEDALRQSEERFRLAFNAIEGIVYDWWPQTGVVHRTGNLCKLVGIPVEEADPDENWWQQRIHPDDVGASSLSLLSRLPISQQGYSTEFRVQRNDGGWEYVCDRGFIIRDAEGVPVRVVGTTYTISERKRLENELKASNQQLKLQADLLASTGDAVIALDADQLICFCNAGAERLYGVKCADVLGKPVTAIHRVLFLSIEEEQRAWSELATTGHWSGEARHILKDGTEIIVASTVNRLSAEAGGGIVAVIRDVTAQKRAEIKLQQHSAQLTRANEDLLHFAYAVGHDLRAPLRNVTSFSQLLALKYKNKLDAQGAECIRWITDAGARMDTMLGDLLEFAKVAGGEADFSQQVSLEDCFATATESLRGSIDETQALVTHSELPVLAGDASQFTQLFENLIGNALKYHRPGVTPEIQVSAESRPTEWIITVRDNGIGFAPDDAQKIFGVFKRLHKSEYAGTGIGLSICKRIVERRGGRIWATAQPGCGATFQFSIPIEHAWPHSAVQSNGRLPLELVAEQAPSHHFDELFHTLALAPAVVCALDQTILIWTKGSEKLFGWSDTEAVGKSLPDLIKAELPQPLAEIDATLLRQGSWNGELKAHKRDGSVLWLATHKILYRDGSGRPQSVIQVHNDITALKEAQAALLRSSEQRDLAITAAQMGIWRWDKRTGVVEWSETLERMLGMEPGSFEGTFEAFQQRAHPDHWQETQQIIQAAFENGPEYAIENRLRRNDGTYVWVRGQGKVIFDENHEPAGIVGVVWDISERKQTEFDRQFFLDLSSKFSEVTDQDLLIEIAIKQLMGYLKVGRCVYSELDSSRERLRNIAAIRSASEISRGVSPLSEYPNLIAGTDYHSFIAVSNVESDPRTASIAASSFIPFDTRSFLSVPLYRDGEWKANLSVSDSCARVWEEREIRLLRGVAERLWPMLENARLLKEATERREQFESTFEQAAVGLAHVALDGSWLRVNQRLCSITGYSREELLARNFQQITHPDDLANDLESYDALKRGEMESYSIEKRYFRKDGSIVWINLTVALVKEPSGAPKYAISVVEDITARKETARQLEQSNQLAELRLREIEAIYYQAGVGLLYLDKDLRFIRINEHLARMNGFPVSQHLGRTIAEVLPEVAAQLYPLLNAVIETRIPIVERELTGPSPAKPGSQTTWLVSYFPFEGPDGTVLGLNGVVQDITERKRTEAAWHETTERLKIATDAANLGVFVWEAKEDRPHWENQRMYEILGRSHDQGTLNLAEFLSTAIHAEDRSAFHEALDRAMERGGAFSHSCRIRRGDGRYCWIECTGQFELNSDGTPKRLVGVIADVNGRVENEHALREQKQHLRHVLDSLFVFVGVLSLDGVLLEANRPPWEEADASAEEVIGTRFPDIDWWSYSAEAQSKVWNSIRRAQRGVPSRFDLQARIRDGRLTMLDFMLSPLRAESGEITHLIASAVPIEQRKRMEEALRKSEERYLLAEWATSDGLWDWNPATDECYFSPRFKALLGFEDHELPNRASVVFGRMHPDDESILHTAVRLHFEKDQPYDIEIRVRVKDESYRWFRTRGKAIRDASNHAIRMVGSMTDIDDRKKAEAAAREHDVQIRTMIDTIEQLAWMAHADGYIFWYNRQWYEYTGTTPEQMEGWGWETVHDPAWLPEVKRRWLESLSTGQPFNMEFPLRGADGLFRPFLTRVMPLRNTQGKVVKWFGTNTNVEHLRREQNLLEESERKFRELAETVPEMIWVAEPSGNIIYWNPQLYAYTGYSDSQGFADKWLSMMHPDDAPRILEVWKHSVTNSKHHECESRMRRFDGVYRWFLHRAEPVRDENGNVTKWLGTSVDIHEQKLTEQALRRSNEDLEQFAYAASHDLQEPLRTVSIYSQLLARRYGDQAEEAQRFANYIVNSAARMDSLLKGILAYSRVDDLAGDATVSDASVVLKTALSNLQQAIAESGAAIQQSSLPSVLCPETHLLQLFQNLVGNAIKYRSQQRPPEICIFAEPGQRWHTFRVSDNGIGIRPEYFKQIFGIFKRLHRDEYPGVGVGLAICKRIVERHGGQIWAESIPGEGTTFYFTLPAP